MIVAGALAGPARVSARPGRYPMTATASSASTAIAVAEPVFTRQERLALAGFLAGFTGLTRDAYALDLRQYPFWAQAAASSPPAARPVNWAHRTCFTTKAAPASVPRAAGTADP